MRQSLSGVDYRRVLAVNIIEFVRNPKLINGNLSPYQETALRLLYGLDLSSEQKEIAEQALGTDSHVQGDYAEATFICGRRSGKGDRLGANIAVYEATMGGHEKYLAPGERGYIVLMTPSKRQAYELKNYIMAKIEGSELLSQMIASVNAEEIALTNRITITIFPCSFRHVRGFSIPVAILDEFAFFRVEGVNVDKTVVDAIRPAMATFPRARLIKTSTPYAKAGELYKDFSQRHKRGDLLVFQATTWEMNPSIPKEFLELEKERDPEFFEREYAAQFTDTISNAFTREAVEACVMPGRYELPYTKDFRYFAGVDPAGGGDCEFTLSICHCEKTFGIRNDIIVQDCLRAYRSKRPEDVVAEMVRTLAAYHVTKVVGDRYSGEWVRQAFHDRGVTYQVSEFSASEAFLELLPKINQGSIQLLDDRHQTAQLIALERIKSKTGRDTLSHPDGGHDDRANALAIASTLERKPKMFVFSGGDISRADLFTESLLQRRSPL
jgi:hypothetical protein